MPAPETTASADGWAARLELGFREQAGRTVLSHRRRFGPLAVQRPFYPEGETCHVYVLHPPGGIAGGDTLDIDLDLPAGHALITTPGAAKFYRSSGPLAEVGQRLRVGAGARLEWLPQENIIFPGACLRAGTRLDLVGDARALLWEIHCFGRPVIDEAFTHGNAGFSLSVARDGEPLLEERLRVTESSLGRRALLAGRPVTGTLIATGCDSALLDRVRGLLPGGGEFAATRLDDLLALRYLGGSTEQCRKVFTAAWQVLREPVLDKPAQLPRVWAT
ncbi:MAG: urease accessory protein UreD [Chromatiales bacterium]|nr:urease accessory protein UreD [Chromatiales bacterium]